MENLSLQIVALLSVGCAILLASGFMHSIFNDEFPNFPMKPAVIATTYGLGVFGFYTMCTSRKAKEKRLRLGLLLIGFLAVEIANFTLEVLFRSGM